MHNGGDVKASECHFFVSAFAVQPFLAFIRARITT